MVKIWNAKRDILYGNFILQRIDRFYSNLIEPQYDYLLGHFVRKFQEVCELVLVEQKPLDLYLRIFLNVRNWNLNKFT